MRIALIILSILSLLFIGAISWSLVNQETWSFRMPTLPSTKTTENVDNITLETWKNQVKTDEKLERLTTLVEELAKKNGTYSPENIIETQTGTVVEPAENIIKPSGKLLALLMPTITPELDKNSGIYGLYIFDTNVAYSTYRDATIPLTFIAISTNYETFLKNMKSLGGKPYTVNEIKTFPFRAFFVNTAPTDAMVRLVVEMEWQTVALEMPKPRYDLVKNLLLGKWGTNIKSLQSTTKTGSIAPAEKKTIVPKPVESITPSTPVSVTKTGATSSGTSTRTGTTIRIIQ